MRIEQLEYVIAVARLGSFRAAAEELYISQPALSETVRNLERELGVHILDRKRSGATVSAKGRELLPHMVTVLDAIDGLRRAAGLQKLSSRVVRLGTVTDGAVPLVTAVIRQFHHVHPETQVEVVAAPPAEVHRGLLEGGFDLGLVEYLDGDDLPPELETTELLYGQAVACLRPDDPLASLRTVRVEDLIAQPLIVMRPGYVMHRLLCRLFDGEAPSISYSTDGAQMGKLMVGEGLGVTVLPDYSVVDNPLERFGVISQRPLDIGKTTAGVRLVVQRPRARSVPLAAEDLHVMFVKGACSFRMAS